MITEMLLSGLFFLLIVITNLASNRFGYQTFGDLDKEAKLEKIGKNPRRFKKTFILFFLIINEISVKKIDFIEESCHKPSNKSNFSYFTQILSEKCYMLLRIIIWLGEVDKR